MPNTHCLPAGSLGTDQIPVGEVSSATVAITDATGGAGHRRGICVFLHASTASDLPTPYAVPNTVGITIKPLSNSLVADGWVFCFPNYPGDFSLNGVQYQRVGDLLTNWQNDVTNDSGHGSRLVTTLSLWWDHLTYYLATIYGPNRPTFVIGFSEGAYASLSLAINRTKTLIGYGAHSPPTIWSNISGWGSITTTGMDLSTTALNGVTIPGIIGLSDNDATVGWALSSQSTVLGMSYQGGPQSNGYLLANNAKTAGQPVTIYPTASSTPGADPVAYPNGHLFLSALSPNAASLDAAEYASWVSSTLDPNYPVSF